MNYYFIKKMKKNRIEKTIIKIFNDFEEGNLPDELNEWFIKYMPERNRKNISNEERCIANTHKRERCIKKSVKIIIIYAFNIIIYIKKIKYFILDYLMRRKKKNLKIY